MGFQPYNIMGNLWSRMTQGSRVTPEEITVSILNKKTDMSKTSSLFVKIDYYSLLLLPKSVSEFFAVTTKRVFNYEPPPEEESFVIVPYHDIDDDDCQV